MLWAVMITSPTRASPCVGAGGRGSGSSPAPDNPGFYLPLKGALDLTVKTSGSIEGASAQDQAWPFNEDSK